MTEITLHWFLPTYGDSRNIMAGGHGSGLEAGPREPSLAYLKQIALAAETNGFESMLVPTGQWCNDAWVASSALIPETSRLKFLIAFRPGIINPVLIGQQAQTFQDLSKGRLLLNVVIGGEDSEQRTFGDDTTKIQRYERADEALEITSHLWRENTPLDYEGEYYQTRGSQLARLPYAVPPIYFGGSSEKGIEVAGKHSDVYLTWGEPLPAVSEKLSRVAAAAKAAGRDEGELEYGIRLHVISRETEDEAWEEAQRLLDGVDEEKVREIQKKLATSQSEGQRRMTELHNQGSGFKTGDDARSLEIAPNLWAGVGLIRGGAGTALVGSHRQVAERIAEYREAGLKHVVLSGYPHLEETYAVGEGVVPELQQLGYSVTNHPDAADNGAHDND